MSTFDEVLIEQRLTFGQLQRVLPNYRKIGKDKFSASKTRTRIVTLQELWQKCTSLDVQLHQKASSSQSEEDYFKREEFLAAEIDYEDTLDQLHAMLEREEKGKASSSVTKIANSTIIGEGQGPSDLTLPRITVPTFNGNTTKWESFRDSFNSLVGANTSLTPGQKLHYLKSFLIEDAALLIEHVSVSDANYDGAWQILVEEYDNLRALVFSHIQAFANLPGMKNETAPELKSLRDAVSSSLAALKNLNRPVEYWDDLIIYIVSQKFSTRTRVEWNLRLGASNDIPSFKMLRDFMTERIRGIAPLGQNEENNPKVKIQQGNKGKEKATIHTTTTRQCSCCSKNHFVAYCFSWLKKTVEERYEIAKKGRLCFNCLKPGHFPGNCPNEKRCVKCKRAHHTSLHRESFSVSDKDMKNVEDTDLNTPSTSAEVNAISTNRKLTKSSNPKITVPSAVLLATAWVRLRTKEDRVVKARALLDQGSSHTFITESLAQQLRTTRCRANLGVNVFGSDYTGRSTALIKLTLESCQGRGPSLPLVAHVYQKITSYAADKARYYGEWPHLEGITLADPYPHSSAPIDLLIGADLYGHLLLGPIKRGPLGSPTAQLTTLGWVLSGPTRDTSNATTSEAVLHCIATSELNQVLMKFWEVEEIPAKSFLTPEEQECEDHFVKTHSRDSTGRYIVRLPFRNGATPDIGESHQIALKRYAATQRRLSKDRELAAAYNAFLTEYESMGHMERVNASDPIGKSLYMTHHPVIREESVTTRLRVVFNASSPTSNGTSLNDYLLIGEKLQRDIASVLLNWRLHRFVCVADIAKMFRQILIHPEDANFQRIVWKPSAESDVFSYKLLTVTYGTSCAPYLANRVLLQLAEDEGSFFTRAVDVVRHSTYVDDVLFGHENLEQARAVRDELNALLQRGGFQLRKWAANDPELLKGISGNNPELTVDFEKNDDTAKMKVLGISWNPVQDQFNFQIRGIPKSTERATKRSILSFISRLYDPLGWASPAIITAKILMQDLWLEKLAWDDEIPNSLVRVWEGYLGNFPKLATLRIPRWIRVQANTVLELHGFADASSRAYAAVVFVRVLHSPREISSQILMSKTKVAPLKTVSIPRLELNAIVLLVRLLEYVKTALKYDAIPVHGWTDSTVALAWISQHPSRWKSYVANRVSEIQTKLPEIKWHHVPTQDNPADCASRGITAGELKDHPLWWSGPQWLQQNSAFWPKSSSRQEDKDARQELIENELRATAMVHVVPTKEDWNLALRFSSWGKLLRVTALVQRFVRKLRSRGENRKCSDNVLLLDEIQKARNYWIRKVQGESFSAEIKALRENASIPRSSPLKALNPFLDGNHQLRLGGRLRHSFLSYDERFPIILPRHYVSELIVDQAHLRTLHGGTQLTLRVIRQNFWIIGARSVIKNRINRCLICVREKAVSASQLMGDLPSPRVNPSPPFSHCGVDYAGPLQIIPHVGRGQKTRKYYVAIFICLVTRAIHLEYVSDYATSGFLAAFRRFVSRRVFPTDMYSDNGTNFQGADNELRRAFLATFKSNELREECANEGIKWHFIPAAAPHFGGLWEAGVKSFKYHLKRVVGAHTISQLELSTLLCQIEATLNSRPLIAFKDDPDSFDALTPGHFLIGRSLLSVPEPSLLDVNENRLSRWQRVQAMREHIWRAWSRDYLHSLQQRAKWQEECRSVKTGDLVVLKNHLLPPARWELARIIETHPGPDGLVRVVTLRTAKSQLKRPITKVCPLPIASTEEP